MRVRVRVGEYSMSLMCMDVRGIKSSKVYFDSHKPEWMDGWMDGYMCVCVCKNHSK